MMRSHAADRDDYERALMLPQNSLEQCERRYEQTDFAHDLNPDPSPGESWFRFYWSWIFGSTQPQG
jgi:hypothetical protein